MRCLWPKIRRKSGSVAAALLLVSSLAADALPSVPAFGSSTALVSREQNLRRAPAHTEEFAPIYASAVSPSCASVRLPEALLTPDPVMQDLGDDLQIRVSFIIGADGRVHSAFILDSGGRNQDRVVLRAIGHWRYRPALCNGVPTPMEGRVSFVLR